MKPGTRIAACLSIAAATLLTNLPATAASPALPPRSIGDIVAQLRASPPQTEKLTEARQLLDTPIPDGLEKNELVEALRARGRAAELLGLTDRYLASYRAAWEASGKSMEQQYGALRVEYSAAEIHAGNVVTAIRMNEEVARTRPNAGGRIAANAFLAETKARHGDIDGAVAHLNIAEDNFAAARQGRGWGIWGNFYQANIERARAGVALAQGKYAVAENHFRNSARFRELDLESNQFRIDTRIDTITQPLAVGFLLMARKGVADMLLMQGRLVEAEMLYREIIAQGIREFGTGSPLMQTHLEGLASVLVEQGRAADARELATTTLDILLRQGTPPESRMLIWTRLRLAAAYVAMRRWPDAMAQYDAISEVIERDSELKRRLGRGGKGWALTLIRSGRPAEALRMTEELLAFESRRFTDDDVQLAEVRGFHAMALAANGRTSEALAQFRKAVPVLVAGQRDAGDEGMTAAAHRLVIVLESYLRLLDRMHREQPAPAGFDAAAEAFRVADVARSSTVQKALIASAARAAIHDPALAVLARNEQDLSNRIAALTETMSRLVSAPSEQRLDKVIADMRRDLPLLKEERRKLRERIAAEFPAYERLINPKPLSPTEMQPLLGDDEAMLSIYVGDDRTYVWAIPKSGTPQFFTAPLPAADVRTRVGRLLKHLEPAGVDGLDLGFDLDAAHDLYAQLIAPARGTLATAKSLLVVPHGALGRIPLALLPTQAMRLPRSTLPLEAYARVPWLIRDFAITQLPSASTLAALRTARSPVAAGRAPFIGFGDPQFSPRQAAPSGAPGQSLRTAHRVAMRASVTTRNAASAGIADLAPLPDTASEVREMAAALAADPADALRLGLAASEGRVKGEDLSRYRVIAFATHGLTPGDLDGLSQPALALSNPALTNEAEADGLLTMEEILGLKMNADWVVLSACNTASGDGQSAEALSGLGRAFFHAGTRAVLATFWPVETVSARLLTTELFRRQSAQPELTRAQALRAAMLAVMEMKAGDERSGKPVFSYAHPLFWAPYSLVGDGGR